MADEQTQAVARREPSIPAAPDPFVDFLERAVRDTSIDISRIQQLLDMQREVRRDRAEQSFYAAMNAAQSEMKAILRDAKNSETKQPYARLETIDRQIRPIVTNHGFSLSYGSAEPRQPGAVRVVCHVAHIDGHSRDYELEGALDTTGPKGGATKTSIQGLGSTVSYLRKYLKLMIFDLQLTNEDNDGASTETITDEQVMSIGDMVSECGLSDKGLAAFLRLAGCASIREIPAYRYQDILQALRDKLRSKQGGK